MIDFSSYEHFSRLGYFMAGILTRHVSSSNPCLYNIREPKYKQYKMGHKISRHQIVKNLTILKSDIPFVFFVIFRLPDTVQKCFCTQDGAVSPTVQRKYISAFQHVCVCSQKNSLISMIFKSSFFFVNTRYFGIIGSQFAPTK